MYPQLFNKLANQEVYQEGLVAATPKPKRTRTYTQIYLKKGRQQGNQANNSK